MPYVLCLPYSGSGKSLAQQIKRCYSEAEVISLALALWCSVGLHYKRQQSHMTPVGRVIGGVRSVCVEDYTLTAVAIGYCTLPYSPLPEKEGDKKVSVEVGGSCVVVSPHIPDIPLEISTPPRISFWWWWCSCVVHGATDSQELSPLWPVRHSLAFLSSNYPHPKGRKMTLHSVLHPIVTV